MTHREYRRYLNHRVFDTRERLAAVRDQVATDPGVERVLRPLVSLLEEDYADLVRELGER